MNSTIKKIDRVDQMIKHIMSELSANKIDKLNSRDSFDLQNKVVELQNNMVKYAELEFWHDAQHKLYLNARKKD